LSQKCRRHCCSTWHCRYSRSGDSSKRNTRRGVFRVNSRRRGAFSGHDDSTTSLGERHEGSHQKGRPRKRSRKLRAVTAMLVIAQLIFLFAVEKPQNRRQVRHPEEPRCLRGSRRIAPSARPIAPFEARLSGLAPSSDVTATPLRGRGDDTTLKHTAFHHERALARAVKQTGLRSRSSPAEGSRSAAYPDGRHRTAPRHPSLASQVRRQIAVRSAICRGHTSHRPARRRQQQRGVARKIRHISRRRPPQPDQTRDRIARRHDLAAAMAHRPALIDDAVEARAVVAG